MPTKKKSERQPARELPKLPKELLDQLPDTLMTAEAIEEASAAFKKALIERARAWGRGTLFRLWRQVASCGRAPEKIGSTASGIK